MEDLWNKVSRLGLANPAVADPVQNFRKVWEPWQGHIYLIAFTADGDYWNFTRKVDPEDSLDPALSSLLNDLAALSWADNVDGDRIAMDPKRYDYGPDPYATYRANAAEAKAKAETEAQAEAGNEQ